MSIPKDDSSLSFYQNYTLGLPWFWDNTAGWLLGGDVGIEGHCALPSFHVKSLEAEDAFEAFHGEASLIVLMDSQSASVGTVCPIPSRLVQSRKLNRLARPKQSLRICLPQPQDGNYTHVLLSRATRNTAYTACWNHRTCTANAARRIPRLLLRPCQCPHILHLLSAQQIPRLPVRLCHP
jgi:hypothetical protein